MTRRTRTIVRVRTALAAATAFVTIVVLALVALVAPSPAGAEEEISIAPDSVVRGDPGSVTEVASASVPAELVGSECVLTVVALNGSSTHPGNVLIVSTGDTQAVIPDVEAAPDGSVVAERTVALGATITLEIKLGDSGISSLGSTAGFDRPPVEPTVLGSQQLPEAPKAEAHHAEPTYTG
ncbi:MAG: hypothetical protein ACR2QO_11230 [Acidimicrobiales bacterium]